MNNDNTLDTTKSAIEDDLKSIEEMRDTSIKPKEKGLRHQTSIHTLKKRKRKIALQKSARKTQRGKR